MNYKDRQSLEQAYQSICESIANPAGAEPAVTTGNEQPADKGRKTLTDEEMQAAMAILTQYAQEDMSAEQTAQAFQDLFQKGVKSGPSQDDMHYTKI